MAGASPAERHWGCRVHDQFVWQGYRAVLLQNEALQLLILTDKGAEIVQLLYKPLDVDCLWRGPNGLRPPGAFVPTRDAPNSGFFDRWSGGWFEVVPNGGPACEYKGAPLGFFGETINIPWQHKVLVNEPEQVTVRFWVNTYRTPFLVEKTLTLKTGEPALFIEERLTNQGRETADFVWGHHPVVGAPFLDETCRISAPDCEVEVFHAEDGPDHRMGLHQAAAWPIIQDRNGRPLDLRVVPGPESGTMDNCYLKHLAAGWVAVHSQRLNLGFGLAWDVDVFRYAWIWQAFGGGVGYPWYGRTYCLGLEPWTSYPCVGLADAIANGTARQLEAGESLEAWLTAVLFRDCPEVQSITREGRVA
jgi:hypothetical protein